MKSKLKKPALVLLVPFGSWAALCNFESIAMIKEHRQITVQQPREKVFAFLTDDSKLSSWVKGIVSIEPFGEPKEGVGAKARLAVKVPTEMEFVSTISEWEPPRRFAWSVDLKEMASTQIYTLDEVDGGTRITLHVEHVAVHPLAAQQRTRQGNGAPQKGAGKALNRRPHEGSIRNWGRAGWGITGSRFDPVLVH